MNKLFTKIATLSVGLAMAIGVGVAVGSKEAKTVSASLTYSIVPDGETSGSSSTSYVTTDTSFTFPETNGVSWHMKQWNPSTLQIKTNQSSAGSEWCFYTGKFPGKITKVEIYFSSLTLASTSSTGMYVVGSANAHTNYASSGGTQMTWDSTNKKLSATWNTSNGYYAIAFYQNGKKATGTNKLDSTKSIVVTYEEESTGYSITTSVTNGTYTGDTSISKSGNATVTISPNTGYKLPSDVTVTGATKSYNSTTGVVSLSNPSGNVTISATCPALQSYSITKTITNGSASGDTSITENGNASVTITPNTGYKLPSDVTVTGATKSFNSTTGVVSLSSPTGNVTVSATMDAATQYLIDYNLTRLTASPSPTTMYENQEVSITLSVSDSTKYALPSTISVTNSANYGYNSSSGVITLHGSQGNVTITASAVAKPAEASEGFDFTDSTIWDDSQKDTQDDKVYSHTEDLITMTWESNGQSSKAGAYWNPGRIYQNHIVTISAATGQGAVTTIKSVTFHTVKNGSSSTTSGTNNAEKTVTQPTIGYGTIASAVSGQDVTYTITGTVTEFTLQPSAQTRWSTVEIVYMKDQSDVTLNSITATCNPVLVSQKIKPTITFNPQNATNKNVTYAIVENTGSLASVAEDGTITGLGNGTARLKITPEDTHASAITIDVTINALPNIYGVEVGKKYAMVKNGNELSAIYDGAIPNYGQVTSYSGNPEGVFQVEINSETKYLSYDAALNGNSLNLADTINRESSWIFAEVDSALVVRNVEVYGRYLAFSNDRFACYQALSASIVSPEFVELAEEKTDKEYVEDFVDLYMHMTDYTENKGWCSDGEHSYYLTAKAGYNSIIYGVSAREALWTGDIDFAAAKLRYETWAVKNNDSNPYDGYDDVHTPIKSLAVLTQSISKNTSAVIIIVVISAISVAAIGGYFLFRKKKED